MYHRHIILAERNPVIVIKLLEASETFESGWLLISCLLSPFFNVLVAFSCRTILPTPGVSLPQDHLIGLWKQERAHRGSRPFLAAIPHTCLDLWCAPSRSPHSVLESSYSKLCPSFPPWSFCSTQKWKKLLSRGSSSLKYTTALPSSGVPILYWRVQVTDAAMKVPCVIREVFSWQPVSRLVRPWPRRGQPNEYQLWNSAVGTLFKLAHAHNYAQHIHTGHGHWRWSREHLTE